MPLPLGVPLWMLGAGALGAGAAFGVGSVLGDKENERRKNEFGPGLDLLNAHLQDIQERQQRIRGELSGDLGLTPEWADRVAVARADDKYQNWLKQSQGFELGGQKYRWVAEDSPEFDSDPYAKFRTNQQYAEMEARRNTKDPGQYQGSYENLINEKQRLTGKRYIPVRVN